MNWWTWASLVGMGISISCALFSVVVFVRMMRAECRHAREAAEIEVNLIFDSTRLETGIVQCGKADWPGLFIRGDNAFGYAIALQEVLPFIKENNAVQASSIEALINRLKSCDVGQHDRSDVQMIMKVPSAETSQSA